ncbi:MAG: ABC transporter substrate-binding protein [Hyphomicrobiaceae bacterium]|nr:ABC transporter substrate-binding protein [Hyphomicrobiaceae bacterium]
MSGILKSWKRPGVAALVGALTIGAGWAAAEKARAADGEVPIVAVVPMTGPYADTGPLMERGARLAIEHFGGSVAGKKIKLVIRDSETKSAIAARRVQEAIDTEKAAAVIGPWSSGVALAVTEVAKKNKVVYWFSGGTEDISGKRCHRYAFMWAAAAWTAMDANLKVFKKANPNAKTIYLFVVDYAFGWTLQKYVEQLAPKYGLKVVGVDRHPLGHREYSAFITKAMAANPDAVYMINFGLDAITAVRQLYNFGFTPKKPVVMSWSAGVEELIQLDAKQRANLIVGSNYYPTIDTPANKKFVADYTKKYGQPPGYGPAATYGLMTMVLTGMKAANSTDPKKVVEALEKFKGETFIGPTTIDARTHQTVRPYFVLKTKPADKMKDKFDFAEIVDVSSTPQPADLNECKKGVGAF